MPRDLLDAASELCDELYDMDFFLDVQQAFGGDSSYYWNNALGKVSGEAVELLPSLFQGLVVTTNYDELLEKTYNRFTNGFPVVRPGDDGALNRVLYEGRSLLLRFMVR